MTETLSMTGIGTPKQLADALSDVKSLLLDEGRYERLRTRADHLEAENADLKQQLREEQDAQPKIAIQTGCGIIYQFSAHSSFGVLELADDLVSPHSRSYLRDDGEGDTHCVAYRPPSGGGQYAQALVSGTEAECQNWLAHIAHAIERAGIPVVLSQPLVTSAQAAGAQDDARRWGK